MVSDTTNIFKVWQLQTLFSQQVLQMCFLDLKTALCDFQLGDFRFSDGHKKPSAIYPTTTEGKQPTKSIIRLSDHNLTNNRWVSTRVQIWENQGHIKPQKSSKFTNITCSELVLAKYFSFWRWNLKYDLRKNEISSLHKDTCYWVTVHTSSIEKGELIWDYLSGHLSSTGLILTINSKGHVRLILQYFTHH